MYLIISTIMSLDKINKIKVFIIKLFFFIIIKRKYVNTCYSKLIIYLNANKFK